MKPRWQKVIRDILGSKGRTILVVAAIAVGVFSFGAVFITQDLLLKNIKDSYLASAPSTVSIYLSGFDPSLIEWVKTQYGVSDATGKASFTVRVQTKDEGEEILSLIAVPDYSKLNLNLLLPEKGKWPPEKNEIILERNSIKGTGYLLGDTLKIKTSDKKYFDLTLMGSVYDNSSIPYIFTKQLTGFVSWDTLPFLGFPKQYNLLEIATTPEIKTLDDAEKMTFAISENLQKRGVMVMGSQVRKPNQHWATDNSKAFTAILSVVGSFSLILSGFLVVNTISALLAQQKKQIGIMKAIGAKQEQIILLYLVIVGVYGMLALLIALPVSLALGMFFLKLVTDFLNLDINSFYLPLNVFLMEFAASLIVPVVAALIPIIQSAKKSVRVAISDYSAVTATSRIDMVLAKIGGLSRPILISLRNVFRKRGRLLLTLGTLIVAGALFMGVINVRTGMYKEMDRILQMYDFEVSINLANDYETQGIISRIADVPGVVEVEARNHLSASRIKPDGTKGAPFDITGLPYDTVFSHPVLLSGRWLEEGDKDKIVLSSSFSRDNPDIYPGDELYISTEDNKYRLQVVGIVAMSGERTVNFSDFSSVSRIKDTPGLASSYLIKTQPNDVGTQSLVRDEVDKKLKDSGINVSFKQTKNDIINSAASQFNFMIFFLLTMAVMVAIVGGLGLAGTMSLNVLERTREIGIMRSIGATDAAIRKVVLVEGLIVGFISFILSVPVSLPLTYGFCYAIGNAFFGRTLVFAFVPMGAAIWFGIVLVIATIASLVPAKRASEISISETLAYE